MNDFFICSYLYIEKKRIYYSYSFHIKKIKIKNILFYYCVKNIARKVYFKISIYFSLFNVNLSYLTDDDYDYDEIL